MVAQSARRLSRGSELVDSFLQGGYEHDAITTVYGPAGCGKTNLALLAAISAVNEGRKVVFVDTEGGFSVERLKQLTQDHKKVMQHILFLKPTSFEEQTKSVEKISTMSTEDVGLIVIDSMTMLYRLERHSGEEGKEFTQGLGQQIRALCELARKQSIPVLLTSQVYAAFDSPYHNAVRIVGGDILKYASKCLLEIQSLAGNRRKFILRKHRSIPGEGEMLFSIVHEGIAPALVGTQFQNKDV